MTIVTRDAHVGVFKAFKSSRNKQWKFGVPVPDRPLVARTNQGRQAQKNLHVWERPYRTLLIQLTAWSVWSPLTTRTAFVSQSWGKKEDDDDMKGMASGDGENLGTCSRAASLRK